MSNLNINPNMISSNQADAMAASSAMVVSGLEKELKSKDDKVIINDTKLNLKQMEEYIQKLTSTSEIEKAKKRSEHKHRGQKEDQEQKRTKITAQAAREAQPFEWKTKPKTTGNFIVDWFRSLEKSILENLLHFALQPGVEDLIKSADELKINLQNLKLEKFSLNHRGEFIYPSELTPQEIRYLLLSDELRILQIGMLLEDSSLKRYIISLRKKAVIKSLKRLNTNDEAIEQIITSGKHVAWLKLIHELKAGHLKRVFCGSKKDFEYYSKIINNLTQKIREIDLDIPESNLDWIRGQLNTMALETAEYKLKVLFSMQKLKFDKNRQKDIHWLEGTIRHLKHA